MLRLLPGFCLLASLAISPTTLAQEPSPAAGIISSTIEELIRGQGDAVCAQFKEFPSAACNELLIAATNAVTGGTIDFEELKNTLTDPKLINSAVSKAFGGTLPFGVQLKIFDSDNNEASLGLSYDIKYAFLNESYGEGGNWNKRVSIEFNANGNVAFEQAANPNDFLDTKLTIAGSWSTALPQQDPDFGAKLTRYALDSLACDVGDEETQECRDATESGFQLLDDATSLLNGFYYLKFGLDAGLESDQAFTATQGKVSAFAFAQFEDWGRNSILGALQLTPAVRVAIDRIDPDGQTPRSMLGDSTSFYRFSGEASLWVPLHIVGTIPLVLTVNFRYYKELAASTMVRGAGLDDYDLLTLSVSGTNGVFVSFSTGALPLDADRDNVVEVGWRVNF